MPFSSIASNSLYDDNPFRVTGLHTNATAREIAKLVERLKMMAELGVHKQSFAFALNPPPDLDRIRTAAQNLKDVESRLISSFFWFWADTSFGKDPAMHALAQGDHNEAGSLWMAREEDPEKGFIARHNLAVMYHLIAIEWTKFDLNEQVNNERTAKILDLWRESLNRWKTLFACDAMWNHVESFIRDLRDPGVSANLARKMRDSLPLHLPRINGELALQYAESGRIELCKEHVRLMLDSCQNNAREVVGLVLEPRLKVIRNEIGTAKSADDPVAGMDSARRLAELCIRENFLFGQFGEANSSSEIFDDAARVCNISVNKFWKATQDAESCADLLKKVLPLSVDKDLRQTISDNLKFFVNHLNHKPLDELMEKLKGICECNRAPADIFSRIIEEIVPEFSRLTNQASDPRAEFPEYFDLLALAFRGVSLDAWNNHRDKSTAEKACNQAIRYVQDKEIRSKLAEDRRILSSQKEVNTTNGLLKFSNITGIFSYSPLLGYCPNVEIHHPDQASLQPQTITHRQPMLRQGRHTFLRLQHFPPPRQILKDPHTGSQVI